MCDIKEIQLAFESVVLRRSLSSEHSSTDKFEDMLMLSQFTSTFKYSSVQLSTSRIALDTFSHAPCFDRLAPRHHYLVTPRASNIFSTFFIDLDKRSSDRHEKTWKTFQDQRLTDEVDPIKIFGWNSWLNSLDLNKFRSKCRQNVGMRKLQACAIFTEMPKTF